MKKTLVLLLVLSLLLTTVACGNTAEDDSLNMEPQVSQMKAICELSVIECYYHNVAKFKEGEDERGFFGIGSKYKHFWIEYSGIVRIGIDVSLVNIEVNDTQITITIPEAKVLGCTIDSTSLTKDSFIVDKESIEITAEDEIKAFEEAQAQLQNNAANDKTLLANAQQQAMSLLEDYVLNIGNAVGKQYSITWVYVDSEGNPLGTTSIGGNTESEPVIE